MNYLLPQEIVEHTTRPLHIQGLKGSAPAFWLAQHLQAQPDTPFIVFLPHSDAVRALQSDLNLLLQEKSRILYFPALSEGPSSTTNLRQLEKAHILTRLLQGHSVCMLLTPQAFAEPLPSPTLWQNHLFPLAPGSQVGREFLVEFLTVYDFVEVDKVSTPGEFAWRGGVVDVFSYAHPYPIRLRLEDDTIVRIQRFDPDTQRSQEELSQVWLLPPPNLLESQPQSRLIDFLPEPIETYLVEGQACLAQLERMGEDSAGFRTLASRGIELGHAPAVAAAETFSYPLHPQPSFPHNISLLYEHLRSLPIQRLYLFVENEKQRLRLERLLEPAELHYPISYIIGSLAEGFHDPHAQVAFYTDHQIFRKFYSAPVHRSFRRSEALVLKDLYDLQIGDYVVHERYGIAQFGGLVPIPRTDPPQEGIKLVFAEEAVVYLPVTLVNEIARYRGIGDVPPKLSRLGSQDWKRTTERVRKRIKELAIDLVRLYARRKMQSGYAFSPDSMEQLEMESRFPYEETPDQLQAIIDVKRDMESPHPMDRLLCGDVGFGKTEVALRAAFKATRDGKQVALLAPTTVLVMQHLRTFEARLEGFPVRIAALSRLQSSKQQKDILKRLAAGDIDIIIGTHRLLSEDVQFKDLGLLIIDEEHKFGVMAKEKLREQYPTVDTLAMSATPIPRTLQMALSGIRDISIISTPPQNRLPIETRVVPFSWSIIKDAIERELSRQGQVFFVHNQIKDLPRLTEKLRSLVPEAQLAFVHAQMPARQVEDTLLAFIYQQIDVLVTTNLVESGLDIPNANIILVHHAHRFGLSDLHQLRGRVGRGGRQAYCYFLIPDLHLLTQEAQRRLEALEEFSDLGSGFQIALRDLEIRGAGDFLGREQSGFIADVGYELYQRYLEEAIAQIKEEEGLEVPASHAPPIAQLSCIVEADWPAHIPQDWIPYPATRLEIYRKFSSAADEETLQNLLRELIDRFGSLPTQVLMLADVIRLRRLGDQLSIPYIVVRQKKMRLPVSLSVPLPALLQLLDDLRPKPKFHFSQKEDELVLEVEPVENAQAALYLLEMLQPVFQSASVA
ncbi:MAG: transcription-repair coupling factor [Bacteroidia bacterium]|nr:transcription-repair coupling factor [Bacteroidia bacterium]